MKTASELVDAANRSMLDSYRKLVAHSAGGASAEFGGVFAFSSGLPLSLFNGCVVVRRATASDLRMGSPGLGNVTSPTAPGLTIGVLLASRTSPSLTGSYEMNTHIRAWSSTQFPNPRRLRRAWVDRGCLNRWTGRASRGPRRGRPRGGESRGTSVLRVVRGRSRREILHSVARWPTCRRLDRHPER